MMKNNPEYRIYKFEGVLSELCHTFINEKRALGCLYNSEAYRLNHFTRFILNYNVPKNTLPQNTVLEYLKKIPMETDRNRYARFSVVKTFAQYMLRMGYDAYCPQKEELGKIKWDYTPYIFTHEEISRFFKAAYSLRKRVHSTAPRRHIIMPVLLRMIYCCGLRASEATKLLTKDVSLTEGILTIRESKFGKERYVPMSDELTKICNEYAASNVRNENDYFFRSPSDGEYSTKSVYYAFREILWKAGISHGGRGKGPRVHDFRHTFAVHCLERWILDGKELSSALPGLSTYLGHEDLTGTEHYLRMTSELFPKIIALLDQKYGYIIPKEGGDL